MIYGMCTRAGARDERSAGASTVQIDGGWCVGALPCIFTSRALFFPSWKGNKRTVILICLDLSLSAYDCFNASACCKIFELLTLMIGSDNDCNRVTCRRQRVLHYRVTLTYG